MRSLSFLLIATLMAACADSSFFRTSLDNANPAPTTINGTVIESKAPPPKPQKRVTTAISKAAQAENERIIQAFGGVYSNRHVEDQLARIVSKLVAKSEVPTQSFQITILNSPAVNAFALPGGFLYITRGLLALGNDASEIAAVLAHEMAHVTNKHSQKRLRKARKAQLISQAVEGVISDSSTLATIQANNNLDFIAFSQAQELDADVVGVKNASLAGYDPFAAARFLESMLRYQSYRTTSTVANAAEAPDFLSSHPTTPRRVEMAQLAAQKFGDPGIGQRDRKNYLKALDGMIFGDDPTEGFVRDRSFFHPQLRFTFSVPNGYIIDNTTEAVLARARNGDAIRLDGVEIPGNLTLSDYIQSGWLNGLNPQSVTNFTVNGAPAVSATAITDGWSYKVTIIRSQTSTYRMIFATQKPSLQFDRAVSSTVKSFRSLSPQEALSLSPLRIKIVRVKRGDAIFSVSRSMRGLVANPDQALKALNGLKEGDTISPGMYLKTITDDVSG